MFLFQMQSTPRRAADGHVERLGPQRQLHGNHRQPAATGGHQRVGRHPADEQLVDGGRNHGRSAAGGEPEPVGAHGDLQPAAAELGLDPAGGGGNWGRVEQQGRTAPAGGCRWQREQRALDWHVERAMVS